MGSGQGPSVNPKYQSKGEGRGNIEEDLNMFGFPITGKYWESGLKHRDVDFSGKGRGSTLGNRPL